jgi:hypothetical protein
VKEGQGFARRVRLANLQKFSALLRKTPVSTEVTPKEQRKTKSAAAADSAYADAAALFSGKSLRVTVGFKKPQTRRVRATLTGKVPPRAARDVEMRRRVLATGISNEQGFHYPQGVHLGHLLAIVEGFVKTKRRPREFEKRYIRLEGELDAEVYFQFGRRP